MTTIKDIARECGVSANTVSCVLNNKAGEVSAQTRERVLAEIRRLGYRPNAAARRMGGKRTHTIGIADQYITNTKTDPYRVHLLEPIVHAAREHN
jgi:LacI family transcriptional regulator